MEHEIYVSREVKNLGHNNSAALIKKAVNMALDAEECERDMDTGAVLLGDMMISVPRCETQGEEFGHGYEREIMYLTVHSILHLLGYDHMEPDEAAVMEAKQAKALEDLGITR